jgi:hypothetical protein
MYNSEDSNFLQLERNAAMKRWKRTIRTLILSSLLFSCINPVASYAKLDQTQLANQLIILPQQSYDTVEANAMINRIFLMYPNLIEGLIYNNVKIKLTRGKITDEPEMAAYKGVTPRGWDKTWDEIPGSGGNPVLVRIGYSQPGSGHGSFNLELHETFHAIDYYLFHEVSSSNTFKSLWQQEVNVLFKGDNYIDTYPEEYFAEVSCMYFANESSKAEIREKLPKTYAFIDNLFKTYVPKLPWTIDEINGHWAEPSLHRLIGLKLLLGLPDGTIQPGMKISREQFIKLLVSATNLTSEGEPFSEFKDVPQIRWSYPYIDSAMKNGIIRPEEYNGQFRPQQPITRIDMAVWTARALQLEKDDDTVLFKDNHLMKANLGIVSAIVNSGIMKGVPGNLFNPRGIVTRAQAAVVIEKVLNYE